MFRFKRRGRSQKRENQFYNQRNRNHKLKSNYPETRDIGGMKNTFDSNRLIAAI